MLVNSGIGYSEINYGDHDSGSFDGLEAAKNHEDIPEVGFTKIEFNQHWADLDNHDFGQHMLEDLAVVVPQVFMEQPEIAPIASIEEIPDIYHHGNAANELSGAIFEKNVVPDVPDVHTSFPTDTPAPVHAPAPAPAQHHDPHAVTPIQLHSPNPKE